MSKFYQMLARGARKSAEQDDRWVVALPAIVADNRDPERQHRIRVVIPDIDENLMFEDWVRQLSFYVGPPGYGAFFLPAKGSEVVLFGQLGQKHNLFYISVFNEDFPIPPDFADETAAGIRVPADFKLLAEADTQINSGRILLKAEKSFVNITGAAGVFTNGRPS
jgi:hypothetical protein